MAFGALGAESRGEFALLLCTRIFRSVPSFRTSFFWVQAMTSSTSAELFDKRVYPEPWEDLSPEEQERQLEVVRNRTAMRMVHDWYPERYERLPGNRFDPFYRDSWILEVYRMGENPRAGSRDVERRLSPEELESDPRCLALQEAYWAEIDRMDGRRGPKRYQKFIGDLAKLVERHKVSIRVSENGHLALEDVTDEDARAQSIEDLKETLGFIQR